MARLFTSEGNEPNPPAPIGGTSITAYNYGRQGGLSLNITGAVELHL